MIEKRLIDKGHEAAKRLIDEAKNNQDKNPLKNALAAFYLKASTGTDNSVEFFHKSFGEFLMAERLAESFWKWTERSTKRPFNYTVIDTELDWKIYDLLGYGLLTPEILGYLMPLLKLGEPDDYLERECNYADTEWVNLFERLYSFYVHWSQGEFIESFKASEDILPLKKARQLQQYNISLGQRQADIYTGLNILMLLLKINTYAQNQEYLREKIQFYPCGNPDNAEEFDDTRLLKIIGYTECLQTLIFWFKFRPSLSYANLMSANLMVAKLVSADLSYADLRNADLRSSKLTSADLRNADLRNADLSYADLKKADFSYANLVSADLSYADLRNADLRNADLKNIGWNSETDWRGVRGLDTAKNVPEPLKQQLGYFVGT
jgi:hypothetical protein